MTDIWVCSSCHSINRQRNAHCYKCGSAQATAATGEMATHRQEQAIATRMVVAYRPAAALGLATAIFLLGIVAVKVAMLIELLDLWRFADAQLALAQSSGTLDQAALSARLQQTGRLSIVNLAIVVPTLVFFAAWLGRVVSNVPALGGGLPGTNPGRAFVSTLIPLLNLKTVPGTIQDVLYRLDPKGGGVFMVMVAWVGLVGSWILSFIGGRYLDLRLRFDTANAETLDEAVESVRGLLLGAVILDIVTSVLIGIGAIVLILLMMRIERRSRARDREIRAVAGV
jgi:RNA polymerase subunit RPABC4/transcription elongation factor Spt4